MAWLFTEYDVARNSRVYNNNKDFIEGNTISTKLISLAALQYLQIIHVMNNST